MKRELSTKSGGEIDRAVAERQGLQQREALDYFISEAVDDYENRSETHWARDYSAIDAYLNSVEPNRQRLRDCLGTFSGTGDLELESAIVDTDGMTVERVSVRPFEEYDVRARALLGYPDTDGGPFPLIICQHGAGGSPERVFGYDDPGNNYHSYGRRLVEDGYAVLAPLTLNATTDTDHPRARCETIANLLGKSYFGFEVFVLETFLDCLYGNDPTDELRGGSGGELLDDAVGMWGISMGGALTQFALPLIDRIDVGISTAFFNHRPRKMVLQDPSFSAFLPVGAYSHFFVPGWLREFSDADLLSLICPRPFQIQTGRADGIDWRPHLLEEYERASAHYEALGIEDRLELVAHEGGHEIEYQSGVEFLDQYVTG